MRSWATLAVVFLGFFAAAGCNDYGSTFQNNTGALISSLSPSNTNAGSGSFTLTVNGSGFAAQTKVTWNGGKLNTTVTTDANGNVLTVSATVPASLVANPGTATVITQNPFSGAGNNGLSNPLVFTINPPANPVPTLTSISPNSSPANGPALTLMLTGTNFIPASDPSGGSQVLFNLPSQQATLANPTINSTTISVTIPANLLQNNNTTSAVAASVTVFNPPSPAPPNCLGTCTGTGGGPSKPQAFTINAPGAAAAASAASTVEETPAISSDGRYVAYTVMQDGHAQTFLRDTCQSAASSCTPRTILISAAQDGSAGNDDSHWPSMSSDGRYVAFSSSATNLTVGSPSGRQIYLRDTCLGAAASCAPSTQLVSSDASGALVGSDAILPSVSSSGRFIAFISVTPSRDFNQAVPAKSSAAPANSGYRQVFVRDTCLGAPNCTPKTSRISLEPGDTPSVGALPAGPALSGTAKNIALADSGSPNLFTRSVPIDDSVFLAITNDQP